MIKISNNVSLQPYNTFGIEVTARHFVEITKVSQLLVLLSSPQWASEKKLFLGGGSNILLLNDFEGLVVKLSLKGISIVQETDSHAIVEAGAGEVWHDFVMHCLSKELGGAENLSLIPGTVGAAPMQNIGAYGVEIKDFFHQLQALNLETLQTEVFDRERCAFGYRESYFKHEGKDRYVILSVQFTLSKQHKTHTSYGAIRETLEEMGVATAPSIQEVSEAVIRIRKSKLPDPAKIGNSGSFFKNPEISKAQFLTLQQAHPTIPGYAVNDEVVKVPAGWLIEQAGWKGKRFGAVGVHPKQALVLVNYGGGKGVEVADLAERIQFSIKEKFGIHLSPEVNYIR